MWSLDHFQSTVFGEQPPEGSLVAEAQSMSAATLPHLLERHPNLGKMYSLIRSKVDPSSFNEACRLAIGHFVPLADLLWHYEEIAGIDRDRCGGDRQRLRSSGSGREALDAAIAARLEAGESLAGGALSTDNFGKLLDRLLVFRKVNVPFWRQLLPLAEQLLDDLKGRRLALIERAQGGPRSLQALAASVLAEHPAELAAVPEAVVDSLPTEEALSVAVLGDASASMQVCVNAACICGAMLSAVFEAELIFFNDRAFRSVTHAMPRTAEEVLAVTEEVRAGNTTSPAVALAEFYTQRKPVDIFIVVTDEEENSAWKEGRERQPYGMSEGFSFAQLFQRYRKEVHPSAKCVFVSFLAKGVTGDGQMVRALHNVGIEATHVKYDQQRPDLSKFDSLLGSVLHEASKTLDARAAERAVVLAE